MDEVVRAKVKADFDSDPTIGDRRQELVFIGQDLKVHTCMHACTRTCCCACMVLAPWCDQRAHVSQ